MLENVFGMEMHFLSFLPPFRFFFFFLIAEQDFQNLTRARPVLHTNHTSNPHLLSSYFEIRSKFLKLALNSLCNPDWPCVYDLLASASSSCFRSWDITDLGHQLWPDAVLFKM